MTHPEVRGTTARSRAMYIASGVLLALALVLLAMDATANSGNGFLYGSMIAAAGSLMSVVASQLGSPPAGTSGHSPDRSRAAIWLVAGGLTLYVAKGLPWRSAAGSPWISGFIEGYAEGIVGWTLTWLPIIAGGSAVVVGVRRHRSQRTPPAWRMTAGTLSFLATGAAIARIVQVELGMLPLPIFPFTETSVGIGLWLTLLAAVATNIGVLLAAREDGQLSTTPPPAEG